MRTRKASEISSLPDYIVALIWYNATISGNAILIRDTDPYVPRTVAQYLRGNVWESQRNAQSKTWVYKAHGKDLVRELKNLGFTGRENLDRQPAPVDPIISAQVLMETHASLGYALQYDRHHPRDKGHAYYTPRITIVGAEAVIRSYADTLNTLGAIPHRKLSPAANHVSQSLRITSRSQLEAIRDALMGEPCHRDFWDRYNGHIAAPSIPYEDYKRRQK